MSAISKEEEPISLQNSETCMLNYLSTTIVVIAVLEGVGFVVYLQIEKNTMGKVVLICSIINSKLF